MPCTVKPCGQLVCFLLAFALFVSGLAASSASAEEADWPVSSWMERLFGHGGTITVKGQTKPASSIRLGQLAIPGSHDSTAHNMGGFARECGNPSFFQEHFGKGLTQRYARTQHHDLYFQATHGVRSFDIRPYYTGSELRTCHTLDAGSLKSAFEGEGGLNRFLRENPKEVVILNFSHYRPGRGDDEDKHDIGIAAMARFLRTEVCPRAVTLSPADPGSISLQRIWDAGKQYVVVVDDEEGLHDMLERLGLGWCMYEASELSGGYAGERDNVDIGGGRHSSTNLWQGLYDQVSCGRKFVSCDYGRGPENADTVREATEKILLDKFRGSRKSLHETSYIWVYGQFGDFGNFEAAKFRANLNDSSLLNATDKRRLLVDDGYVFDTYVDAGLKPYAENFINRLGDIADTKKTGEGVGVVNMDAIGRDDTFEEFVRPLLRIDRALLDD